MTLKLRITREVKPQEVADMVFGTGALSWPWWQGARLQRYTANGNDIEVIDPFDDEVDVLETDVFRFTVDDPNEPEGSGKTVTKVIGMNTLVSAASNAIAGIDAKLDAESAREMAKDELGLADAIAADVVMQLAVFGSIVYG